jgi:oligopeptide/dipeptide ABC transporter ATP-binding protein
VPLLEVSGLRTYFHTRNAIYRAVDGVSFTVQKGETLGIVGESGSGKSVTCYSIMGLLPQPPGRIEGGSAIFDGIDLLRCPPKVARSVRGKRIAMIFQDPMTSLNPYLRISEQLIEPLVIHEKISRSAALRRGVEMLEAVGINDAARSIDRYPHEFSGGMCQRVMIAMALITRPELLIADEPTTALDVTVQAQILALLERLQRELGMAVVIITHDLGVVAEMADDIAVMYAGRIVETASAKLLFAGPEHPYTWGLLKSIPSLTDRGSAGTRKEQLVPIPGMPPSLINRPSGCHFHPRCPYSQPEHTRIDPQLQPIPGEPTHHVACLLEPDVRRRLWGELHAGRTPEEARTSVGLPAPQEKLASAAETVGDMPEVGL